MKVLMLMMRVGAFSMAFVCSQFCFSFAAWAQEAAKKPPLVLSSETNLVAAANGGSVVYFSSQLDEEYWKVTNLIDGGTESNGWMSKKPLVFPQDIVFAFKDKSVKLINKVVIDPSTPDTPLVGRWINAFEIHVSTESAEGPYKRVMSGAVRNERGKQEFLFNPVEARYVKLRILSNHGSDAYVSLGEVEVYEAIPGASVLYQLIARLEQLFVDLKRYRDILAERGIKGAELPTTLSQSEAAGGKSAQ